MHPYFFVGAALLLAPAVAFADDAADLIVHNAKVVTLDAKSTVAEAVGTTYGATGELGLKVTKNR